MDHITEMLALDWETIFEFVPRIAVAILVLAIFYVMGKYLAKLVLIFLHRATIREVHESFFRALVITVSSFFGLIIALNILGLEKLAVSLLAGGGVTAVVLGFAFREIGENFIAGIFLAFSRPFKKDDLIRTEDIEGYVREIELRYTHLRTEDGRDVYVPSSQLFGKAVTNFTRDGLRRISFTVGIDYANDALHACELLKAATMKVDGVLPDPVPTAYIAALGPAYVELQAFFWIDVFTKGTGLLAVQSQAMDNCRRALLEGGYTVSSETTANVAVTHTNPPGAQ